MKIKKVDSLKYSFKFIFQEREKVNFPLLIVSRKIKTNWYGFLNVIEIK